MKRPVGKGESMKKALSEINAEIRSDREEFLRRTDEALHSVLTELADELFAHRRERPVILLSGPSGSGKTTTAMYLERLLDARGCETHTLSLDNYFRSLTPAQQAAAQRGEFDLEAPARVDAELLNGQLEKMIAGEPVELPRYDFQAAVSVSSGKILTRRPDDLVILEGTHALNPELIGISEERSERLYVSVRTRIVRTDGRLLHPSRIRLMRRMIRDRKFRARSLRETAGMFDSVEAGEERYIMPYKNRADHEVDTFVAYEPAVYRPLLLPDLERMQHDDPLSAELYGVLNEAAVCPEEAVPADSLIREFIGNGSFEY